MCHLGPSFPKSRRQSLHLLGEVGKIILALTFEVESERRKVLGDSLDLKRISELHDVTRREHSLP